MASGNGTIETNLLSAGTTLGKLVATLEGREAVERSREKKRLLLDWTPSPLRTLLF